ncbi:MAG: methenyltetrahydromethanopterin cyclohydrolase [Planctomycetota bacterium]
MTLNENAAALCQEIERRAGELRVGVSTVGPAGGATRVMDLGIATPGGLEAGRLLAKVCLGGLAEVEITAGSPVGSGGSVWDGPAVQVRTDHPVAACMASQYAGWEVAGDGYFAMGSGPFRAAAAREAIFKEPALAAFAEPDAGACVGVLETSALPTEAVCGDIAAKCGVAPADLTLLAAPTNSQAGAVQVVARSVETALHKLHELGFDLARIESGWGTAPLPPVAGDALSGIGRTNDAVLYGGHAVLYVRGDDASLAEVGPQTPSNASADHGRPFKEVFAGYDHDFYKIDKLLFSPAVVTFVNLDTGATLRYGAYEPAVIAKSFGVAEAATPHADASPAAGGG